MACTVGFGKLAIPVISNSRLPADVQEARILFKQRIREYFQGRATLKIFENGHHRYLAEPEDDKRNRHSQVLPTAAHGQTYFEYQVGTATVPTLRDPNARGCRRLIALVDSGARVLAMYFTDEHYEVGSIVRLQHP
jgi:hypothetical protein